MYMGSARLRAKALRGADRLESADHGRPTSKQLTAEQKARDRAARLQISKDLGHEREQVSSVYLGC